MFARPVALALFLIFATSNAEAKKLTIAAWSFVFLAQSDQLVDERSLRVGSKEPGDKAPQDDCPVAVDTKVEKKKLSRGYRWMKHSAEYKSLAEKTYMRAAQRLRELVAQRPSGAKPWVVVIDADETILNNLGFQRESELKN